MSSKFAYIYSRTNADKFLDQFIDTFKSLGFSLLNTHTNQVEILDETGETYPTTEGHLQEIIQSRKELSSMFWNEEGWALGFTLRPINPSVILEHYWLNGVRETDLENIITTLVDRFKSQIFDQSAIGMVIDVYGTTVEFSWDDFILGEELLNEGDQRLWNRMPTILALRDTKLAHINVDLSIYSREQIDKFIILQSQYSE